MTGIVDSFAPGLFAGRGVLVTGGTSGIGLGAELAFRDLGAGLVAAGATEAGCARAGADAANGGIKFCRLDVREDAAIGALVEGLARLDVVVNAAGVIRRDVEHDPEVFAEVVAINLTGTMRVCAAAKGKLVASGGSVVNMASMLTFFGGPRVPGYSASKGGIAQLTKSLAAAWAGEGVRVNAVAPGWITPERTRGLVEDQARSAAILARTPMKRWGMPSDVGGAVAFLCSDAARFIT